MLSDQSATDILALTSSPHIYRGRLAPSPTGYLHLGHARTFWIAAERARAAGGLLILRNDDLDPARCRPEFAAAMLVDLRWLGLDWVEGPDIGGPHAPYDQSRRRHLYRAGLENLHARGLIFPCRRSRRDVADAAGAPHEGGEDARAGLSGRSFRPPEGARPPPLGEKITVNWRLRVPDGLEIGFEDGGYGHQSARTERDFGDFLVWRKDDCPSYQLACVVDDAEMGITEVVRGADLIKSTFRQLLLYRALELSPPRFHHCPLVSDASGERLAKRHHALSLRALRALGWTPARVIESFA